MDTRDDLILAIDLGTSAAKVIVFDLNGRVIAVDERATPLRHPEPTWIESDADTWWQTATAGIRAVLEHPNVHANAIRAIGVCGFQHTLVPIDANGRALTQPMLWPDQRCADEARDLTSYAETFIRITGRPATSMSSAPRIRWLARHNPEAMARVRFFLLPKDYLRLRLTGEIATDDRDAAGTGLIDHATGDWSPEILDIAGVSPTLFPRIRRCDDVAGTVSAVAASETGLLAGIPVVIGSADWFSTIVGSGCYLPEQVCLYLGTAGIIGAFTSEDERRRLGQTAFLGSVTSTGSALRWARELFDGPSGHLTYAAMAAEAETSEPGARGVFFLPHLMGERGGTMRPAARGTFHGLTLAHRRADVFRAVFEGTALWLRATTMPHLAKQTIGDFVVLGGGARSPLWRRIVAATYRRRLLVPAVLDGGALGTAMIAAIGAGLRHDYGELAREWVRVDRIEEPDPVLVERYAEAYDEFTRVESVVRQLEEGGKRPSP